MCLASHAKLQAPKASPEICKPDGAHCISSARIERLWTMPWKKNKHRGRGGKVRQMGAFCQCKCNICYRETAQTESDGRRGNDRKFQRQLCNRQKEEQRAVVGMLWLAEEWRRQGASLLSFKCQWLNLSSFVLWPFKMPSRRLWSLRLHSFNWIRW